MKRPVLAFLLLLTCVLPAAAGEKEIFGPTTYTVKERYGAGNSYTGSFAAADGLYLVRFQLGTKAPERPEFVEFTMNGEKVLRDDTYEFGYLACILRLRKNNSFEIGLKDAKPSGFKRPKLPPRYVIMSVLPYTGRLPEGAYGLASWEELDRMSGLLQKIANPASTALAVASVSVRNDPAARAQAMRQLADKKDMSALPFISAVFSNPANNADVRGEAAIALGLLGAKESIPMLVNGILDAEEKPRLGSARALSYLNEEDTREPFMKLLERLDAMRRDAVMAAVVSAGWKPVSALMTLAESEDPYVSRNAVGLLGSTRDPRATELLLKLLKDPGRRDVRAIISSLGDTHDPRALEPLLAVAQDPARRAGKEVALGEALAALGDQRSAPVIVDLMKRVETRSNRVLLQQSYKRLTGSDYR